MSWKFSCSFKCVFLCTLWKCWVWAAILMPPAQSSLYLWKNLPKGLDRVMVTGKQVSSDMVNEDFVIAIELNTLHAGVIQHPQEACSQTTVNAEWGNSCPTLFQRSHKAARSCGPARPGGLWAGGTIAPSCCLEQAVSRLVAGDLNLQSFSPGLFSVFWGEIWMWNGE